MADAVQEVLGKRVRRLRRMKGWSQSQLVAYLRGFGIDMHQTTLAKLENGQRPTTAGELVALRSVLGAEYDELLDPTYDAADDLQLAEVNQAIERALQAIDELRAELIERETELSRLRASRNMLGSGEERKFELYQDKAGKYRFRLKDSTGQVIAQGDAYETKAAAQLAMREFRPDPGAASRG